MDEWMVGWIDGFEVLACARREGRMMMTTSPVRREGVRLGAETRRVAQAAAAYPWEEGVYQHQRTHQMLCSKAIGAWASRYSPQRCEFPRANKAVSN